MTPAAERRSSVKAARAFWRLWVEPVISVRRMAAAIAGYTRYLSSWRRYQRLAGAEKLEWRHSHPALFDALDTTPFDPHYLYQAVWAMECMARRPTRHHVDVGSDVRFVSMLTTLVPVTFVDIRPLRAQLARLTSVAGSLVQLPFASGSLLSASCLHVAEHIGLGRYGDPLDPAGTRRACAELARVLAPGGDLYFSLPVGRARVCFNAHRIHAPEQIFEYFKALHLVEFACVDDQGNFKGDAAPGDVAQAEYACGLFHFRRSATAA